jgi:hypothetical protein
MDVTEAAECMRPPKDFPPGTAAKLKHLLTLARNVADQRRIQSVLIRALDASPPARIAEVKGVSVATIRVANRNSCRRVSHGR